MAESLATVDEDESLANCWHLWAAGGRDGYRTRELTP